MAQAGLVRSYCPRPCACCASTAGGPLPQIALQPTPPVIERTTVRDSRDNPPLLSAPRHRCLPHEQQPPLPAAGRRLRASWRSSLCLRTRPCPASPPILAASPPNSAVPSAVSSPAPSSPTSAPAASAGAFASNASAARRGVYELTRSGGRATRPPRPPRTEPHPSNQPRRTSANCAQTHPIEPHTVRLAPPLCVDASRREVTAFTGYCRPWQARPPPSDQEAAAAARPFLDIRSAFRITC